MNQSVEVWLGVYITNSNLRMLSVKNSSLPGVISFPRRRPRLSHLRSERTRCNIWVVDLPQFSTQSVKWWVACTLRRSRKMSPNLRSLTRSTLLLTQSCFGFSERVEVRWSFLFLHRIHFDRNLMSLDKENNVLPVIVFCSIHFFLQWQYWQRSVITRGSHEGVGSFL